MDMKMSIVGYLLELALQKHFGGNKSKFAAELNWESANIYRLRRRFAEGGHSAKAAENLLALYQRNNFSLDEAVSAYGEAWRLGKYSGDENFVCENNLSVQQVFTDYYSLVEAKSIADAEQRLLEQAIEFLRELTRIFCTDIKKERLDCLYCSLNGSECLCKEFAEFLRKCMEAIKEQGH